MSGRASGPPTRTLWKPAEAAHQAVIANALGWLGIFEDAREEVADLTGFAGEVRDEGFRSAVLLGMGGSSLAPEVFGRVLGLADDGLELHVLDSTDPTAVLAVEAAVDLDRTLFVVASKSGGTTETAAFHSYFYERVRARCGEHAGAHFVAITDEGTSLENQALDQSFRAVFVNPGDIGGRYSALSFFGLVPAALMGADLARLLDGVDAMAAACGPDVPVADNAALRLGVVLGELARHGRDKLTLVCAPPLAALGGWIEQLVAESTGKEGVGILPVDLEDLAAPEAYGADRVFCHIGVGAPRPASTSGLPRWSRPATRCSNTPLPTSTRSAARCCAGSSLQRSPARCSGSIHSISRTSRRARTTPSGCSAPTRPRAPFPRPPGG